ncbi:unnamed protein product, partial [Rotaria sp. Silwood2]
QFQCHHVIQLYGICSRIRSPYVVMKLMENGDLKNYLYCHRQCKINPNGATLSESAMIQLALDIADGMYYLSDQKFVHRDLAARNCLVNENHVCKVGDFGLARDIYETDYYRRCGRSFLPIRWMAPESLRDRRFDTVSDVWSFGVLLWEIVTLAVKLYQGYSNEEIVHYVRYGNITLERSQNCPEILEGSKGGIESKRCPFDRTRRVLPWYTLIKFWYNLQANPGAIDIYDVRQLNVIPIHAWKEQREKITCITFSRDHQGILTTTSDGSCLEYNKEELKSMADASQSHVQHFTDADNAIPNVKVFNNRGCSICRDGLVRVYMRS